MTLKKLNWLILDFIKIPLNVNYWEKKQKVIILYLQNVFLKVHQILYILFINIQTKECKKNTFIGKHRSLKTVYGKTECSVNDLDKAFHVCLWF